jgi:hypothetical protein
MRLEGLGHLKISNDRIGNRTHDLPACSIVPQPITLSRALGGVNGTYGIHILRPTMKMEAIYTSVTVVST